jgi:hypothetical protein
MKESASRQKVNKNLNKLCLYDYLKNYRFVFFALLVGSFFFTTNAYAHYTIYSSKSSSPNDEVRVVTTSNNITFISDTVLIPATSAEGEGVTGLSFEESQFRSGTFFAGFDQSGTLNDNKVEQFNYSGTNLGIGPTASSFSQFRDMDFFNPKHYSFVDTNSNVGFFNPQLPNGSNVNSFFDISLTGFSGADINRGQYGLNPFGNNNPWGVYSQTSGGVGKVIGYELTPTNTFNTMSLITGLDFSGAPSLGAVDVIRTSSGKLYIVVTTNFGSGTSALNLYQYTASELMLSEFIGQFITTGQFKGVRLHEDPDDVPGAGVWVNLLINNALEVLQVDPTAIGPTGQLVSKNSFNLATTDAGIYINVAPAVIPELPNGLMGIFGFILSTLILYLRRKVSG